ncbi:hypothetical protein [Ruegeria sp.]|uniref:hypothetical protein n=1 Tax=Ruegeria sp. TaxID=1879320 RepID=UPI003B00BB30
MSAPRPSTPRIRRTPITRGLMPGRRAPTHLRLMRRLAFTRSVRAETWQLLADVLAEGGTDLVEALEALAGAYRARGRPTIAAVLEDLRASIARNRFEERLADYTGADEQIVFQGYRQVEIARVMRGAARILQMQIAIRTAIVNAVALPILLLTGLIGLLFLFGLQLYPALTGIVDLDTLPRFHQHVIALVSGFTARPWIPVVALAAMAGGLAWALPNWAGRGRVLADRMPPFALARLMAGAGFLFATVEAGRAGQGITTRFFRDMAARSRPYARSRIGRIADMFERGGLNLGTACRLAEQGFPAPELGPILEMLWNRQGGIEKTAGFLDRWLARIETTIKVRMVLLNAVLLAFIATAMLVLMSVALPIVDQITRTLYI